jgi:hypothetical protein
MNTTTNRNLDNPANPDKILVQDNYLNLDFYKMYKIHKMITQKQK